MDKKITESAKNAWPPLALGGGSYGNRGVYENENLTETVQSSPQPVTNETDAINSGGPKIVISPNGGDAAWGMLENNK